MRPGANPDRRIAETFPRKGKGAKFMIKGLE
jgi:hypothetical protein